MKVAIVALVGCVAALALFAVSAPQTTALFQANWEVEQEFIRFVAHNRRSYGTREEYRFRFEQFQRNLSTISAMNASNDGAVYGVNEFADWTEEEFNTLLGLRVPSTLTAGTYVPNVEALAEVDWVAEGKTAPVKNQAMCGSCWAFAAIGALESRLAIANNGDVQEYSEQQLVDCSRSYGNMGCNGGWMDYAFAYMKDEDEHESNDYRYVGRDESCKTVGGNTVRDTGFTDLAQSQDALEKALTQGPVSVAVDASRWSSYRGGIFSSCGTRLNHGVLAVGYTADYWTIKNSWGTSWGEKGFMRLAKGNTCGILQVASYPTL